MTPEELRDLDRQVAEHEGCNPKPIVDRSGAIYGWECGEGRHNQGARHYPQGWENGRECTGDRVEVPQYTRDWADTGPLLEKYGLELMRFSWGWLAGDRDDSGDTPLIAICKAVLALPKEANDV